MQAAPAALFGGQKIRVDTALSALSGVVQAGVLANKYGVGLLKPGLSVTTWY